MKTRIIIVALLCIWTRSVPAGPQEDFDLFRNGEKLVWNSRGHAKAKGIQLRITYPRTWKATEGNRPNVVQKFISESGRGMDVVMLLTRALPKPFDRQLTESEKLQILSREVSSALVPNGGSLLTHKLTKIDGEACAMIESEYVGERVGFKIRQRMLSFIVPRKGVLLMIQCSTGIDASSSTAGIGKQYAGRKPLFLQIASSCVFTEKWKTP